MRRHFDIGIYFLLLLILSGCATKEVYLVRDAEAVKTEALEPVVIMPENLKVSLKAIRPSLATADEIESIMTDVREQVGKTKRFKSVLVLEQNDVTDIREGFFIKPEVLLMKTSIRDTYDPKRKRFVANAKACLKIYDADDPVKERVIYKSEKKLERMGKSGKVKLDVQDQNEMLKEVLQFVFLDLAYKLGDEFNPSYEMGTVEKVSGKIAYIHINTSRMKGARAKDQSVNVIDENNKPIASLDLTSIDDGSISGMLHEKANVTVKPGMKVRARVYQVKN